MGEPWFQVQRRFPKAGIIALSANFTLYGDMSSRVMALAAELGPRQEIYSIDESFVGLDGLPGDLVARAHEVREKINQWTGIPCCIGIGPTKTLAKLANHVAKTADRKPGSYPAHLGQVCNLGALPPLELDALMAATDLGEVWGVGRRIAAQMREGGLSTVLDVARMDPATVRRRWSVVLERTVRELQGQCCIQLEDVAPAKKQIACTRSFGRTITDVWELQEAVTEFACRAAEKLRRQECLAGQILVFIHTSPFRLKDAQYSNSCTVPLRKPTADSASLIAAAARGLQRIYRPGFNFAKAGVMLLDIQEQGIEQHELQLDDAAPGRESLMRTIDTLNDRFGRGSIVFGSAGLAGDRRRWTMRQSMRTPAYTTNWAEIPVATAA